MRCPHCHADVPDGTTPCPVCGQPTSRPDEVLEPELVDDRHQPLRPGPFSGHPGDGTAGAGGNGGFSRIFYTTFPSGQGMPPACLPTIITLALALIAAFEYGLLAAIGFLVFAAIGRAVTFFLTIRHLLEGRFFNPWLPHIITWVVCWLLVAWLSGGLN